MKKNFSQKGAMMVLTAILLPVLLAFTGLAVDVGRLYIEKSKLQNIADAAALAGLSQLKNELDVTGNLVTGMPIGAITDTNTLINNKTPLEIANIGADAYLRLNSGEALSIASNAVDTKMYHSANSEVEESFYYAVIIGKNYPLYFAQIIYPHDTMLVRAGAVVKFDKKEEPVDTSNYNDFLANYGKKGRRTIVNLPDTWPKYYSQSGKFKREEMTDLISNDDRLEADKSALLNIADLFVGMETSRLIEIFNGKYNTDSFKHEKFIDLISSYKDLARVEENYGNDNVTDKYTGKVFDKPANSNTYPTVYTEMSTETGTGFNKDDIIHWLQGDYGSFDGSNSEYTTEAFDPFTRYFFSNEMIMPSEVGLERKLQISFNLSQDGTKVSGVKVKLKSGGKDINGAYVIKGKY